MRTEEPAENLAPASSLHRSAAEQRILRFACGSAAALLISQTFAWQYSYLAAVFAATFLSLPIAPPRLKGGVVFVLLLAGALLLGLLLIGPLKHYELAGLMLQGLMFFLVFYYSIAGGNPLVVSLAIAGLAAVPVVGVVSSAAAVVICQSLLKSGLLALGILWTFHALFPDPPLPVNALPAPAPRPDKTATGRLAARSTLVVLPVITWLLATSGLSYIAVAIKVSSMGQQASVDSSSQAGRALLLSTFIGGVGAVVIWAVLSVWPSLLLYTLTVGLTGLFVGRRIFAGAGIAATGQIWSYGFVTMLIILGPVVLDSGDAAGARFFDRIFMFSLATIYSVVAVWIFDTIVSRRQPVAAS